MFKKYIALLLALCLVLLSACGQKSEQPDTPKEEEKVPVAPADPVISVEPIDLGIPAEEWYSHNLLARCVWDMTIHDSSSMSVVEIMSKILVAYLFCIAIWMI